MGKVCPKEKNWRLNTKTHRRKKEYLRPGALAQLRYTIAACTKPPSAHLCKIKSAVSALDSDNCNFEAAAIQRDRDRDDAVVDQTPLSLLSPQRTMQEATPDGPASTPTTPQFHDQHSDSMLESLPMDILIKILCHLHHDHLRPVFHVCQKIRKAVIIARQFHFNYTTPNRDRQDLLQTITPLPTEPCSFFWKGKRKGSWFSGHRTPKAPRQGSRLARFKSDFEVRQITAALFQESATPSSSSPPRQPKSACKSFASNKALFCESEEELCEAVAQNKLR